MLPQDKWKPESPKGGYAHTKDTNKKAYHWFPHHEIWTFHNPEGCDMEKTGKYKAS